MVVSFVCDVGFLEYCNKYMVMVVVVVMVVLGLCTRICTLSMN